jgi:2-oxoacid:acceptor oxidoreductase delta subunit (pyruvate/2-ketoisovalerate family)
VSELKAWSELPPGGAVDPARSERVQTGAWRTGLVPRADLSRCVNCLLCWIYCPDSAVLLDGTTFAGFDEDVCKGCEICAAVCPVDAVEMVAEEVPDGG